MDPMANSEYWRVHFRERYEELERLRTLELLHLTDEEALRQMRLLVAADEPSPQSSPMSGLVEMQRLLHRRRKP
jgi:hypothetical protein